MSMTLEQAFDALNDTTMRLQNVAVECSNDDMADAMREKARVHARAVATVKAHLAQPAQSVDVDESMVDSALDAYMAAWDAHVQKVDRCETEWGDDQIEAARIGVRAALNRYTAALQEKGNG